MPPLTLEQYDRLWAASEIPMAIVDLDHRFMRCNRAYCFLVGYSASELKLRTWQSITHPDDITGDESSVNELKSDSESVGYDFTKRYLTKAGKIALVQLSVLAIRNDDGHIGGFFVSALPIISDAPAKQSEPFSLVKWATQHPKDATIVCLGGGLLLGRDTIVELLKLWLSK